jgi:hypothetical protein
MVERIGVACGVDCGFLQAGVLPNGMRFESATSGHPVFEHLSHSFIVRIMIEPDRGFGNPEDWKGMIQHVVSGERRYFRGVQEIPNLIIQFLQSHPTMGNDAPKKNHYLKS